MIYLYEKGGNPMAPILAADATVNEARTDNYAVTKYPIEAQANIADYIIKEPKEYNCAIKLTANKLGLAFSKDRVKNQIDALTRKADARTEFSVVFGWWVFDAVIKSIASNHNFDTGTGLDIAITFQTVEKVQVQTTQIPASRLKTKVRRKRSEKPKGTAETTKDAKPKTKSSVAEKLVSAVEKLL